MRKKVKKNVTIDPDEQDVIITDNTADRERLFLTNHWWWPLAR